MAGLAAAGLAACGATPAPAPTATSAPVAATAAPAETATTAAAEAATVAATAAPSVAETGVDIEVWADNWGEEFNTPMQSIGDDFTKATGIKTHWQFYDESEGKLLTQIAAGTPPDTVMVDLTSGVAMYAFQGSFLPLDDYFAQSGIKAEEFIPATWEACLYDGKVYAIPGGADYYALFYNKDVYQDAGLDPEQPPKTLAEWVAHSEKIYKYDSQGNLERVGMRPTEVNMEQAGFLYGGEFYDASAKKITCNQDGVVKALEWQADLGKKWSAEKVAAFMQGLPGYSQPNSGFATGKQAYNINGFWIYEPLDKYAPDLKYGTAFIPTLNGTEEEKKNYVVEGWTYSIPKGSKHPKEAWQFMKWVFYDNAWLMGVKTINGCCVIAKLDKFFQGVEEMTGANNRIVPGLKILRETAAAGTKTWPMIPVAVRYLDEVNRAQDFAVRGEKTAQQALDECAATIQAELDKALQGA